MVVTAAPYRSRQQMARDNRAKVLAAVLGGKGLNVTEVMELTSLSEFAARRHLGNLVREKLIQSNRVRVMRGQRYYPPDVRIPQSAPVRPHRESTDRIGAGGVKALMARILERAVVDLKEAKSDSPARYRAECAWLKDEDAEQIFSFVGICQELGYDPSKIRRKILEMFSAAQ